MKTINLKTGAVTVYSDDGSVDELDALAEAGKIGPVSASKVQTIVPKWMPEGTAPNAQAVIDVLASGHYVTPEMYGAKGDGQTDDTAAFKAALAEADRIKRPLVATGDYKLSETIKISRDKSAIFVPGEIHYVDPNSYAFDVHCKYSELHINRMLSDGMGIKFERRADDNVEVDRNTCYLNNVYCTGTSILMHAETLGVQYNDIYIGASVISYSGDCVVMTADKPGRAWIGEPRFIGGQVRSDNGYAIRTGGEVNGPRFLGVSIEGSKKGMYLSACSNGSFTEMRRENASAIKFVGVNLNNYFSGHTTFAGDINLNEAKSGSGTDPIATFEEPLALGSFYAGEYATCADSSVITYRKRWSFKPRFRIQTVTATGSPEAPVIIGPLANKVFPSHFYTPANGNIKLCDMFDIGGVPELFVSTEGACNVYAPNGKLIAKLAGPYGRYRIFAFNETFWLAQKF